MRDTGTQAFWFLTRGSGAVSLILLTGVVLLGIIGSVGWAAPRWPRFVTQGLHRNLSLMAVAFVGVHVAASVFDGFAPIRWIDAFLPFVGPYRPIWLGLGAVGFDLVLALTITSLIRVSLGYRSWKAVHWLAYVCWPVALVHGLGTGSDTAEPWMLLLAGGCAVAVVGAVWWRGYATDPPRILPRLAAVGTTAAGVASVVGWLMAGPLAPGWARSAGTPVTLTVAGPERLSLPSRSSFTGTAKERSDPDGSVEIDIVGTLDPSAMPIEIVVDGAPSAGGLAVQRGQVSLGSAPDRYVGAITSLAQGRITASISDAAGASLDLQLSIEIVDPSGTTRGTLRLSTPGSSV